MIYMNPFFKDLGKFGWYLDVLEMKRRKPKLNKSELSRHWGVRIEKVNKFLQDELQHYEELLKMIKNLY